MTRNYSRFIPQTLALGALLTPLLVSFPALAQANKVNVTIKDGPVDAGLSQTLNVEVSVQLPGADFGTPTDPLAPLLDLVQKTAAGAGQMSPGLTTGFGLRSYRVKVIASSANQDVSSDASRREDWASYKLLSKEFKDYLTAQVALPENQRETGLTFSEFLRFTLPRGVADFNRVVLCGGVTYFGDLRSEFTIPAYVKAKRDLLCAKTFGDLPRLNFVANNRLDGDENQSPINLSLNKGDIYLFKSLGAAQLCDYPLSTAEVPAQLSQQIAAGWVTTPADRDPFWQAKAERECYHFVSTKVLSRLDEAMTGLAKGGNRSDLNPWAKAWLKPLLDQHAGTPVTAGAARTLLFQSLTNGLTPEKGFVHSDLFLADEFNYGGVEVAAMRGIKGPGLIAILFATGDGRTTESPLRQEFKAMAPAVGLAFTKRLVASLTQACAGQELTSDCLDASRTAASAKIAKLQIDAGEGVVWKGTAVAVSAP